MRNKQLVIVGIILVVVGAVVATAIESAPQSVARREYGILRTTATMSWYESTTYIRNKPDSEFADIMKVARGDDHAALEINLLNGLEARGWELVFVPQAGVYIFARAK